MLAELKTRRYALEQELYNSFSKPFERVRCRASSILLLAIFTYFLVPYSINFINTLYATSDYLLVYLYAIPTGLLVLSIVGFAKIEKLELRRRTLGLSTPMPREAKLYIGSFAVVGIGILAFLAYFKFRGVDIHLISPYPVLDIPQLRAAWADANSLYVLINLVPHLAAVLLIAPIIEEVYFTGLVFAALRNHMGFVLGLGISAALFAIHHAYADPFSGGQLFAFGILFCSEALSFVLYQTTRSLYPSIAYHFLRNLVVAFVELSALV